MPYSRERSDSIQNKTVPTSYTRHKFNDSYCLKWLECQIPALSFCRYRARCAVAPKMQTYVATAVDAKWYQEQGLVNQCHRHPSNGHGIWVLNPTKKWGGFFYWFTCSFFVILGDTETHESVPTVQHPVLRIWHEGISFSQDSRKSSCENSGATYKAPANLKILFTQQEWEV